MAKVLLQPITACFKKPEIMEKKFSSSVMEEDKKDEKHMASRQTNESQPGLIWKVSSGLFNIGSGAVGLGIGSVKWAASTTYNVGTGIVSATQNVASKVGVVSIPKPKKE